MRKHRYEYDVAFSFAGEDRDYVEKVANILKACKINIFYDNFEKHKLCGEDLYKYLGNLYSDKVKYVVIFISKHYKNKNWTKHELKYICEGLFNSKIQILPVKLDKTTLEEIPSTIGYIEGKTSNELAYYILKKLDNNIDVELETINNFV